MRKNCKKKKSEDYMSVWKKRIAVEKEFRKYVRKESCRSVWNW